MPPPPLEDLLRLMTEEHASDLHVSTGSPPALRVNGELFRLNCPPLTAVDTEALARAKTSDEQMERVNEQGTIDFAFSHINQRFRLSIFRERGSIAMAVRLLPEHLLTLDEIGIPASVRQLLDSPNGLILLTGPAAAGKTTSLASMVDVINTTSSRHILTIEDPIEYIHPHKQGIVHQRELGNDVPSFSEGLRRGMRQNPDVILVGEMRDLETMEAVVTSAETGCLVFSTLHTTGATRTVDRIIDAFPSRQQEQVRVQLSSTIRAVVSQILLPRQDKKGRVAAFEVMINTPAVAALIRDHKTFRITSEIQTGTKYGMLSMDQSLADLHSRRLISYQQVMAHAQDLELTAQLLARQGAA